VLKTPHPKNFATVRNIPKALVLGLTVWYNTSSGKVTWDLAHGITDAFMTKYNKTVLQPHARRDIPYGITVTFKQTRNPQ
jgi:hypothetical protein